MKLKKQHPPTNQRQGEIVWLVEANGSSRTYTEPEKVTENLTDTYTTSITDRWKDIMILLINKS